MYILIDYLEHPIDAYAVNISRFCGQKMSKKKDFFLFTLSAIHTVTLITAIKETPPIIKKPKKLNTD